MSTMHRDQHCLAPVGAVIVTHNPEPDKLSSLLESAIAQVQYVVIVDNGSSPTLRNWIEPYMASLPVALITLGDNHGLAHAQNVGIRACRQVGVEYVILFDHDSCPHPGMVARLLTTAFTLRAQGIRLAAIGPNYIDRRQHNPPPFIKLNKFRIQRQRCTQDTPVVEVDYLISSGSLIPMQTLDTVGEMREELFIDYVDIEWGLRAKSKGYHSFGDCEALMWHDLGDTPIRFFTKSYPNHSPLRHYYLFRNAVWLYRQRWVPLSWKMADAWRLLVKYIFYATFAKPRRQHWRMMTKGLWHGLKGRMGKL